MLTTPSFALKYDFHKCSYSCLVFICRRFTITITITPTPTPTLNSNHIGVRGGETLTHVSVKAQLPKKMWVAFEPNHSAVVFGTNGTI